jgi:FkbM family methyltransferase
MSGARRKTRMISYAQNFEDIILDRVFNDMYSGYYIDVGACHPEYYSVTKHFYDKGWSGINIEPISEFCARFAHSRPRDINLEMALGDHDGGMTLHVLPQTGYASFNKEYAERARRPGLALRQRAVQVRRLDTLVDTYGVKDVEFLKIDVEGAESQVLAGWDPTKLRPVVIVIESTVPFSSESNYQSWERVLLEAEYSFQYFDGLNRFYLRNENSELTKAFRVPPNVFDNFVLASELRAQGELTYAKAHPVRWLSGKAYRRLQDQSAGLWDLTIRKLLA